MKIVDDVDDANSTITVPPQKGSLIPVKGFVLEMRKRTATRGDKTALHS